MERRLTAILAADVVGYSRLVGLDEEGTIARLKKLREELFNPCIARHQGRIVKTSGDGTLVEFGSVVDAVRAGIELQEAVRNFDADSPTEQRLELRVGVNIGDVLIDGEDILGDGVNVAARLEALAGPGEVWISSDVLRQIEGKLDLDFEDQGQKNLKNIAKPVRAFKILLEPRTSGRSPRSGRTARRTHTLVAILLGLLVSTVIAGSLAYWRPWEPATEPARSERMAFALPDKPSIAVLPFLNMSDDRSQEYFTDGMTEDLITDLSKVSGLFVISRNSTFTYKGKSVEIRHVAEELGVRYVLEGSVRREGENVRINAQLIDAMTGGHIWADRYDGNLANVFTLQDRVIRKIVTALALRLTASEERRLTTRGTDNHEAYDAFLKGWAHYNAKDPQGFRQAIPYFEKAIALDSTYGRAYAALASIYREGASQRLWYGKFGLLWGEANSRANENLMHALEYPTPLAHRVASLTYLVHGRTGQVTSNEARQDYDLAKSHARKAIILDPNDPDGHIAMARWLTMSGRPEEAIGYIGTAMRLNPKYPPDYLFESALARFGMDDFDEVEVLLERTLKRNPQDIFSAYLRVINYGLLGRNQEMESAKNYYQKISPVDIKLVLYGRFWGLYRTRKDNWRLVRGLQIAGLPQ